MVTQVSTSTLKDIASYLDEDAVLFLDAQNRNEAIEALIKNCAEKKGIANPEEFLRATLEREQIASTGIGLGVAIPHAKLPVYNDFFISIGILEKGIEWGAMDKLPVKIIVLIGGPDDKQTHYLNLLSQLTLYLRDEETRKKLLTLTATEQIIQIFQS